MTAQTAARPTIACRRPTLRAIAPRSTSATVGRIEVRRSTSANGTRSSTASEPAGDRVAVFRRFTKTWLVSPHLQTASISGRRGARGQAEQSQAEQSQAEQSQAESKRRRTKQIAAKIVPREREGRRPYVRKTA